MTEYLFCNDNGILEVSEEAIKALSADFQQVLSGVYDSMLSKFEATMNVILQENDLDNVDFPLIASKLQHTSLQQYLPPELSEKLNLKKDAPKEEEKNSGEERGGHEEEKKSSEQTGDSAEKEGVREAFS